MVFLIFPKTKSLLSKKHINVFHRQIFFLSILYFKISIKAWWSTSTSSFCLFFFFLKCNWHQSFEDILLFSGLDQFSHYLLFITFNFTLLCYVTCRNNYHRNKVTTMLKYWQCPFISALKKKIWISLRLRNKTILKKKLKLICCRRKKKRIKFKALIVLDKLLVFVSLKNHIIIQSNFEIIDFLKLMKTINNNQNSYFDSKW